MKKNIKLLARVTTGDPMIVYCPWRDWLWAYTRGTNTVAYFNGQPYWVNGWNAKIIS